MNWRELPNLERSRAAEPSSTSKKLLLLPNYGRLETKSSTSTPMATATLESHFSVGDFFPDMMFQKCERVTSARSARCVNARFRSSASDLMFFTTRRCSASNSPKTLSY